MLLIEDNWYTDTKQLTHCSENDFILFCVFVIFTITYICYSQNEICKFALKIQSVIPSEVCEWRLPTNWAQPLLGGGKDDLFLTDQWYPPLKICSFAYTIRWYHSFYQEMMLYVLAEPLSKLMNITMGIKAILGYKSYLLNSTW